MGLISKKKLPDNEYSEQLNSLVVSLSQVFYVLRMFSTIVSIKIGNKFLISHCKKVDSIRFCDLGKIFDLSPVACSFISQNIVPKIEQLETFTA